MAPSQITPAPEPPRSEQERQGYFVLTPSAAEVKRLPGLAHSGYWPAWSPDGRKLAIPGFGEIRIVDVDTLSSLTVQSGPPWATEVTWSPDGTRLAFSAEDNDSSNRRAMDIHVYVAASDGTAVRRFSHPRWRLGWHFGAQWHPNGSLLMFTGQYPRWDMDFTPFKEYEHPNVFVAELPGLKVRKVSRSTRVSDDFANWCSRPRSTP